MTRPIRFSSTLLLALALPAWAAPASSGDGGPTILYAPSNEDDATYRADIATAAGATVDYLDASAGTPDLAGLQSYDCVYTITLEPYANASSFGDNLADYVDEGGTVVLGLGSVTASSPLAGRILTADYSPVTGDDNVLGDSPYSGNGRTFLHVDVESYGGLIRGIVSLQGDGIPDGNFSDGEIAQAFRPDGRVVYSNGSGAAGTLGTGDWPQLVANACFGASLDLTVTKLTDSNDGICDGDCSLREAVILSNTSPYPDTIRLGPGTHTLSIEGSDESLAATGDLDIQDDLVIQGVGATRGDQPTVIDAQGIDRIFTIDPFGRGVESVTIRDLILTGGLARSGGAALVFAPATTFERVLMTGNEATEDGGALLTGGSDGVVAVIDSTIDGNTAARGGGGISIVTDGSTIVGSTISNNTAMGEFNQGGGGIEATNGNEVTITNSTLSGNTAIGGRGHAIDSGSSGTATIESSTLARGPSSGFLVSGTGTYAFSNSIVDGSCEVPVPSLGGNLEAPGNRCGFEDPPRGATALRMRLAPLAMNGGRTATHGLAPGSPAIDGGLLANCEATDQRGATRPLEGNDTPPAECDVGAVEVNPLGDDFTTIFRGNFESNGTLDWSHTVP